MIYANARSGYKKYFHPRDFHLLLTLNFQSIFRRIFLFSFICLTKRKEKRQKTPSPYYSNTQLFCGKYVLRSIKGKHQKKHQNKLRNFMKAKKKIFSRINHTRQHQESFSLYQFRPYLSGSKNINTKDKGKYR